MRPGPHRNRSTHHAVRGRGAVPASRWYLRLGLPTATCVAEVVAAAGTERVHRDTEPVIETKRICLAFMHKQEAARRLFLEHRQAQNEQYAVSCRDGKEEFLVLYRKGKNKPTV